MTEKEFIKYYRNRNHLKNVKEAKEKVELELQKNQMLLDTSTGIKVKINPGYSIG